MSEAKESAALSLEDALKNGLVVSKEEIDKLLQEEMKKREKSLKKKLIKEIQAERSAEMAASDDAQLSKLMDGTGLTDKEFARKLRQLNVPVRYWRWLRDEHINLAPKQLWAYIRAQDNPQKRPHH